MNAQVNVKTITPQMAQQMLENQHPHQRILSESYVSKMAEEMKRGNWRVSADAIVIAKKQLANGQHRLHAVIKAGLAQQFLILVTDDERIFEILDCGKTRRVADVIHWNVKNASQVAAISKICIAYENKTIAGVFSGDASRDSQFRYIEEHHDKLEAAIAFASNLYSKSKIVPPSWPAALIHLTGNTEHSRTFVSYLYTGGNKSTCPAAYILRERLIKNALSKSKLPKSYMFGLMIKAYNAFITNNSAPLLRISETEEFPEIITVK